MYEKVIYFYYSLLSKDINKYEVKQLRMCDMVSSEVNRILSKLRIENKKNL